ncbi:hypothetical protein [Haloplanus vescus]|uniref:hypothetical protein n=1 Tax=Haloplanus vescus TaxID=555874 RepID=UPI000B8928C8|nr:hypothetical protein [Haloplanus vescus]
MAPYLGVDRVPLVGPLGTLLSTDRITPHNDAVGGGVTRNNPAQVLDRIRERLPDNVATAVPEIRGVDADGDAVVRDALASAITDGTGARDRAAR